MSIAINLNGTQICKHSELGSKAWNLSRLARDGFPIIPGFTIPATEHIRHLEKHDLDKTASPDSVRAIRLRSELTSEVRAMAEPLGAPFAVRSSSSDEDTVQASAAGKYLSLLEVKSTDLADAIIAVWASAHVGTVGQRSSASGMAVIIQPMARASFFGVAASRDPMTGKRGVVVEVATTPSSVTSGSRDIKHIEVRSNGTKIWLKNPCGDLPDSALDTLTRTVLEIENKWGEAIEIEFSLSFDDIRILQARPIIHRRIAPSTDERISGDWFIDPVHYPRPLTPLFEGLFSPLVAAASEQAFRQYGIFARRVELRSIGGWPYVRMVPLSRGAMPSVPGSVIGFVARVHPRFRTRLSASRTALDSNLPGTHMRDWEEVVKPLARATLREVRDSPLAALSHVDLISAFDALASALKRVVLSNFETDIAHLIPLAELTTKLETRHPGSQSLVLQWIARPLRGTATYTGALRDLARVIGRHPDALAAVLYEKDRSLESIASAHEDLRNAWHEYRQTWGWTLLGYDLDEATVSERPELERYAIRSLLEARSDKNRMPEIDLSHLAVHERALLDQAHRRFYIREEGEAVKSSLLGGVRAVALELGRRLVDEERLDNPELVLYAQPSELAQVRMSSGKDLVEAWIGREQTRIGAMRQAPAPFVGNETSRNPNLAWLPVASQTVHRAITLLMNNEILAPLESSQILRGRPVSAGTHTGPVRCLHRADELISVQAGEVIVAPSISSLWVGGFMRAGALVTESGGTLSHSAIVAREHGIPAVVGVSRATEQLRNGELVTVDGNVGTVSRIEGQV